METTSPNGLELDLGAACDEGAASPVISEALGVADHRVNGSKNDSSCAARINSSSSSQGSVSATMFGVSSVTDFLNPGKSDSGGGQNSIAPSMLAQGQGNPGLGFYRMGRRIGDVHRHFNYCIRDSKEYGVCIYCGHTLQRNTTRQKHHLSTHCPNAPFEVKARYDQERNSIHTRPAIEFQRKRSLDLPSGAMASSIYSNDLENGIAITPMDIPVKIERSDERFEIAVGSMGKSEKADIRCMPDLEFEDDTPLPPHTMSSIHLPNNPSIYNHNSRRDADVASNSESRFRKPLKIWDHSRRIKKGIVVSSLRELLLRGCTKLSISTKESVRPVLEEDGTEVDDEEYLEYLPDNVTIQLLRPGEEWKPPILYDDVVGRSRHIRHRDIYRSDRRDM